MNSKIKYVAREDMRLTKPSVYVVAILLLILTLVISLLTSSLLGYTQMGKNIIALSRDASFLDEINRAASDPDYKPSEKLMRQIDGLMPRVKTSAKIIAVVLSIMAYILAVGYEGYCLNVSRHAASKYSDIFCAFEHFGKVLLIIILQFIFITLWSCLLIFPGIIAVFRYSQSFKVMFDHPEYSALQCITESKRIMRGKKFNYFCLRFSFIGWFILDALLSMFIPVSVLRIFIEPYVGVSSAHFYNLASGWTPPVETPEAEF